MKPMMIRLLTVSGLLFVLSACTTLTSSPVHQYQLNAFGAVAKIHPKQRTSILINQPSAMVGYDTKHMLYVTKPYQLSVFADNSWMSAPANMLLPLVVQSVESSHYFYAVASSPEAINTDYRLELQLLALEQNFLVKPSQLRLVVRATLMQVMNNHMIAETTLYEQLPCPKDTPYGGVLAANQATQALTRRITHFIVKHIEGYPG
jgi:cholesterol transport system auxiliary component